MNFGLKIKKWMKENIQDSSTYPEAFKGKITLDIMGILFSLIFCCALLITNVRGPLFVLGVIVLLFLTFDALHLSYYMFSGSYIELHCKCVKIDRGDMFARAAKKMNLIFCKKTDSLFFVTTFPGKDNVVSCCIEITPQNKRIAEGYEFLLFLPENMHFYEKDGVNVISSYLLLDRGQYRFSKRMEP